MFVICRQSFEAVQGSESLKLKNGDIANIDEKWLQHPFVAGLVKNNLLLVNPETSDKSVINKIEVANSAEIVKQEAQAMEAEIQKATMEAAKKATEIAQENGLDVASRDRLIAEETEKAAEKVKKSYGSKKSK